MGLRHARIELVLPKLMITRDVILAANADGTLVKTIAASYDQSEALADRLSELHNSGEIDFLAICNSSQLDAVSGSQFFDFQYVFCQTLPRLRCPAEAAMGASRRVFEKAGADLSAGLVYNALREWFQRSPERAEEGLVVVHHNMDGEIGSVRPLLLAGAAQDAKKFAEAALNLSHQVQPDIRSDALWALGRVVPGDDDRLLSRVLKRFREAVDAPLSDRDTAIVVETTLHLLDRLGGDIADAMQSLLVNACNSPTPFLRQTLARSLPISRTSFTETMIDAILSALQTTDKDDVHTIGAIDSLLCQWDLDDDRERVFRFLSNLLSGRDNAIQLDALDNFRYRIQREKGEVLGWYVVSLLLTGDVRLCWAANQLLPHNETRDGLDVDLGLFALDASWASFLARKILGYCLFKKESAAALLLSCIRATPERDLPELEALVHDHFLMNYWTAIDWFESAVSEDDPARNSVSRLAQKLESYVDALSQAGTCSAFRPTARERQLQGYRQADLWRDAQKSAEKSSLVSLVAHKATILYGTASITYLYTGDGADPHRQEISMTSHEHVVEIPRLHALDPVGLDWTMRLFRSESPPS